LTPRAASDLGLAAGTAVAAGLIDAHAGGIGTVGARGGPGDVLTRMAYVFGTSACTMTTTARPAFVEGVWGPYFSAMVPGLWLNEGGQSAAGAAIDHLVKMHPAFADAVELAAMEGLGLGAWLAEQATSRGGSSAVAAQVGDLHVVPEFLGNRAPFADPDARGLIAGIGMETGIESLVGLYLAGLWFRLRGAADHPGTTGGRHPDGHHCRQWGRGAERPCAPDSRGFHRPSGCGIDLAGAGASRFCNPGCGRSRRIPRYRRGDDGDVGTRRYSPAGSDRDELA
jgi:sugar (pentulose or hexulose) kinase